MSQIPRLRHVPLMEVPMSFDKSGLKLGKDMGPRIQVLSNETRQPFDDHQIYSNEFVILSYLVLLKSSDYAFDLLNSAWL